MQAISLLTQEDIKSAVREALAEFEAIRVADAGTQSSTGDNEPLLTQSEAVELLRCTKQSLIRWRQKGYLKALRVGRRVLYRKSDLLKALEGNNKRGMRK